MSDSSDYSEKRAFFDRVLTVYGRNPVLETLQNETLVGHALQLAENKREGGIVGEIIKSAQRLGVPIKIHSRGELARISKNGKQDQGVAVDVLCPSFRQLDDFLAEPAA